MGVIAVNTQHSGDPRRDNRGYAESWSSEQVDSLLSEDWLRQMVADIRGGKEAVKDSLPYICPHYAWFRNNHRAQADIVAEAFTHMTCVDVDDETKVEQAVKRALELNADEYSDWQDQVLRIAYSARKKVHIYIRIPKGKTIEEAQQEFCREIDVPYDESCTTPERFIYVTGKDEEVFRSPHWLEPLSQEELEERREAYLQRGLDGDGRPLRGSEEGRVRSEESAAAQNNGQCSMVRSASPLGLSKNVQCPPDARTRFIFRECMKEEEVTEQDLTVEGARHNSVKMILSQAVLLLTKEEFLGVLAEVMPRNWQDVNIQQLVSDFYEKYYDPAQKLTQFQKRVFRQSRKLIASPNPLQGEEAFDAAAQEIPLPLETAGGEASLTRLFASSTPPELPTVLPKLVKNVTSSSPKELKPTVAQGMFPALGAYPKKLGFVYIDNQVRELRINCVVVAKSGAGKDTCMKQPLERITADMRERDQVNRDRLKKFNEEYNSKAGNKQKPQRPEGLVIQNIKPDVTKAALVQRNEEAQGAPLYVRLNELEQWDKVEGCSGRSNQFTTMKLCDDEGNDFGSDRASTQSVVGGGCLHLNWNANTTESKILKYFRSVLNDGPVSRLCLATVPEGEVGADIPVFGDYGEEYDAALKPFIDNLKAATGVVDCKQARRLARRLKDECAEFARLSQDKVFDNLSHRALVMAFRKACLLYAANGMKWERSIEAFCRWSLFYDLYLKMRLFGDLLRDAENDVTTSKRGPRNLLDLLPDEFTLDDAKRVRMQQGMSTDRTMKMISTWKSRQYVFQISDFSFKKGDQYRKG